MTVATRDANVAAVLAVLNVPDEVAYGPDALPDVLPPYYLDVTVARLPGGVQRTGSAAPDTRLYIITAIAVAQTIATANLMWERAALLEDARLNVGGAISTPVTFYTERGVMPDAGWYSASSQWTYNL